MLIYISSLNFKAYITYNNNYGYNNYGYNLSVILFLKKISFF